MTRRQGVLIAGAILLVAAFVAAGAYSLRGGAREDPNDPQTIALGKSVYDEACAACHGENLEGQPDWRSRTPEGRLPAPPHDASGHTWHHADQMLFDMTKFGIEAFAPAGYKSDMPGFEESLSDAEIWAVLAYIRSTWPAEILARQQRISAPAE